MSTGKKLLIFSCIIGLAYSILFYNKNIGISFPIFTLLSLAIYFTFLISNAHKIKVSSCWPVIPIVILSFFPFISANPLMNFFNIVFVISLFFLLNGFIKTSANRITFMTILSSISSVFTPLAHLNEPFKEMPKRNIQKPIQPSPPEKKHTALKILAGGIIALFVLLIFILPLLYLADPIFGNIMLNIPRYINTALVSLRIKDIIFIILIAFIITVYSFSFIYTSFIHKRKAPPSSNLYTQPLPHNKPFTFDSIISNTILITFNLVYVLFTVIQFTYLFSGSSSLPYGLTYAQYARRGFTELFIISIVNFTIILLFKYFAGRNKKPSDVLSKILTSLIGVFTLVIIYSVNFRLNIYLDNYGLTGLRMFVYLVLTVESGMLLYTAYHIFRSKAHLFTAYVIIFLAVFIGLNIMIPDRFIANYNINIARITESQIDVNYLSTLSADAAPAIDELQKSGVTPASDTYFFDRYFSRIENEIRDFTSWQEFNLSRFYAKHLF